MMWRTPWWWLVAEFRVTFGQYYRNTEHPEGWPHPDGWLSIIAADYSAARAAVESFLGDRWGFMYEEGEDGFPTTARYPLGQLHRLTVPEASDEAGG